MCWRFLANGALNGTRIIASLRRPQFKRKESLFRDSFCAPKGTRTPVWALRGPRPGPLDDGGVCLFGRARLYHSTHQSSTRKTCNSPGPCIPIVRDISMSAVREGPVITTAALAWLTTGKVIASANEGRISDAHSTAIWIPGSSDACNGSPSPSAIRMDPVSPARKWLSSHRGAARHLAHGGSQLPRFAEQAHPAYPAPNGSERSPAFAGNQ